MSEDRKITTHVVKTLYDEYGNIVCPKCHRVEAVCLDSDVCVDYVEEEEEEAQEAGQSAARLIEAQRKTIAETRQRVVEIADERDEARLTNRERHATINFLREELAERSADYDDMLRERNEARAKVERLREEIDELLARAWKYDDKPHQLYSHIAAMARSHPTERTTEIERLMNAEYERPRSDIAAERLRIRDELARIDLLLRGVPSITEVRQRLALMFDRVVSGYYAEEVRDGA